MRDLATVVAQIVPVLLLPGLGLPLRTRLEVPGGSQPRAALELVVTAVLIGVAALTEFAAVFGVAYQLTPLDVRLMLSSLAITFAVAALRVLMPIVHQYAHGPGMPERRVWAIFSLLVGRAFIGELYGLARLTPDRGSNHSGSAEAFTVVYRLCNRRDGPAFVGLEYL